MTGVTELTLRVTLQFRPEDVARSALIQTVKNVRCIPGPTFKGAVRATMENWFRELAEQGAVGLTPCVPVAKNALSKDERRLVEAGKLREGCRIQVRDQKVILPDWRGQAGVCPACTLFGGQGLVGFVRCGFLRERDGRFGGFIRVLLSDSSRGWEFGKRRTVNGRAVDLLEMEPDELLKVLKRRVGELKSIGARHRRDASDPEASGSLPILNAEVVEEQRG